MLFSSVTDFLNHQLAKYIYIANSPAYSSKEAKEKALNQINDSIGRELIEAVPIRVDGNLAIAIAPATEKISLVSLQEQLKTNKISFVPKAEVETLFDEYEFGTLAPIGTLLKIPAYCSESIYKNNTEVTFYASSYKYRIRMKFKDYKKVAGLDDSIQFDTTPKYKASIRDRIPHDIKDRMQTIDNCILGVSMGNPSFAPSKLVGITDWINNNFTNCKVLVGDSLYRLTLQISQQYDNEKEALHKALFMGQKFIHEQRVLFDRHSKTCDFEFILASEIQQQRDYQVYYEDICDLYNTDKIFHHSVISFAQTFIGRRIDNPSQEQEKECMLSVSYLLEELAIFSCLIKGGYPIMVYPGSIDVLIEIAEGKHPSLPPSLQKLMYISLFLKRRK